jgi:hypothetical protein
VTGGNRQGGIGDRSSSGISAATDGQADLGVADAAIAAELGVPGTVTAAEFYRTAL